MINNIVMDIIRKSYRKSFIAISEDILDVFKALSDFSNKYIYHDKFIRYQNDKIQHIIGFLFKIYLDDYKRSDNNSEFIKWNNKTNYMYRQMNSPKRRIIDFIAGMTDRYCKNEFEKRTALRSYGYNVDSIKKNLDLEI
jgi:dGTP triphosphohydrolase